MTWSRPAWPSAGTERYAPRTVRSSSTSTDTGTTVSQLAHRAQMTKQAMAELVSHLETHDYVIREPNPADARSKLVVPTGRGREVVAIAQDLVPELERLIEQAVGTERLGALSQDLMTIQQAVARWSADRVRRAP